MMLSKHQQATTNFEKTVEHLKSSESKDLWKQHVKEGIADRVFKGTKER